MIKEQGGIAEFPVTPARRSSPTTDNEFIYFNCTKYRVAEQREKY